MKGLCFLSVAHGKYQQFVPPFMYSIHKAYPDADIRVYLAGRPIPLIQEALDLIGRGGSEIVPYAFEGYKSSGRSSAMWRYLVFTSERALDLAIYKYLYITDIDFLICPEVPTLVEQHEAHCATLGLPYSGHLRRYLPRLVCGRFFCEREFLSYVMQAANVLDPLVKGLGDKTFANKPRHADEHLLYRLITSSGLRELPVLESDKSEDEFDIMDPARCHEVLFNPHHGIHLGIGRSAIYRMMGRYENLFRRKFYLTYLDWLVDLMQDPAFKLILDLMLGADLLKSTLHRMYEVAKDDSLRHA